MMDERERQLDPLGALARYDVRPHISDRPGSGKNYQGTPFRVPYISWDHIASILDECTGRRWHSDTVLLGENVLRVTLTVETPEGSVVRTGVAEITPKSDYNLFPVQKAERAAFCRAASFFGIVVPDDVRKLYGRTDTDSGDRGAESAPRGEKACRCGVMIQPQYDTCIACRNAPNRTPGICASCGESADERFAQCYQCKVRNAPILPQYAEGGSGNPNQSPGRGNPAGALPAPPKDATERILRCQTPEDFAELSQEILTHEFWVNAAWLPVARRQIADRANALGITFDRHSSPPVWRRREVIDG